uniref:Uncharacterized protein n=1 Tax=viral metagenome TaxID=1070528 RepID=A0A6H1ZW08_9ZZZZ
MSNNRLDAMKLAGELGNVKAAAQMQIFFQEVLDAFGGPSGFGKLLAESIQMADKGSNVQLSALMNFAKAWIQMGQVSNDDGDIDDRTAEALLRSMIREETDNRNATGLDTAD